MSRKFWYDNLRKSLRDDEPPPPTWVSVLVILAIVGFIALVLLQGRSVVLA